jgi:hypothetical protein
MSTIELPPVFHPEAPTDLDTLGIPWPMVVDLTVRRLNLDGVTSLASLRTKLKLPYAVVEVFSERKDH